MVAAAEVQVDHRRPGGQPRGEAPEVVPAAVDAGRVEDQPDADHGRAHHRQLEPVALVAQGEPGEQGHEQRVGHVEDVGAGHRADFHRPVEAVDRHRVGHGAADDGVGVGAHRPLAAQEHAQADDDETEQEAGEHVEGRGDRHVGPRPADDGSGQVEEKGRAEHRQPADQLLLTGEHGAGRGVRGGCWFVAGCRLHAVLRPPALALVGGPGWDGRAGPLYHLLVASARIFRTGPRRPGRQGGTGCALTCGSCFW